MTTKLYNGLNRTPALKLAMQGNLEVIDAGFCPDLLLFNWDNDAIVAFVDDTPVGVITFSHIVHLKQIDIGIGYVDPVHRGSSVYREMWDALVVHGRTLGVAEISGTTHIRNDVMRQVADALGRTTEALILSYKV